ncbi:peptide ABC transporter substrate-binding protein [Apilactobacillus apisilvae]|uniref:Peptide ABC transporter substrate-binding protein n=1 Tax=Apilactobacillus apisilvae TaxID=2923364 RepID=A0ABY4PGI5_9LACO|nr:peptide ABC transporter substrate-binding protein [Apilactobacillus apisilvae]UQS84745.1 peptide ABC transporter substrate-binding protein [Apilactobacillus apisilvae]
MNKSVLSVMALTALSSLGLAACGNQANGSNLSSGAKTKTLKWMEKGNIRTLDPSTIVESTSAETLANADQGLLVNPKSNELDGGVAKNYHVSKDGKTYTFNLRHEKWSNGDPVTAKDFVYGFQRSADPKTASQDSYILDHIANYDAVSKGKAPSTSLGVSAPNDYTFVVNLSKPQTYFKYLTTGSIMYPQNQKVVEKYGKSYGTKSANQVYNGPYTVENWNGTNDNWSLKKNNNYWDSKSVKLNKVDFHVVKDGETGMNEYQTGMLDQLSLNSKQQVNNYNNSPELHKLNTANSDYVELNQQRVPAFKNLKLRQALSYALDRNQLVNDVLGDGSKPLKSFVASGLASYKGQDFAKVAQVKSASAYDMNKAKELWQQGLKEVGKSSLDLKLTADDSDTAKSVSEYMQSQWIKLPGLKVTNVALPSQQRVSRLLSQNFDMCLTGWNPGIPDPSATLDTRESTNSMNFSKWKNNKFDALMNDAENTNSNNESKRWDDMVQAGKLADKDVSAVNLYQNATPTLVKTNVHGLRYNSTGDSWDFAKAYVSDK